MATNNNNKNPAELGKEAEKKFMEWLNSESIPYLFIEQSPETLTKYFKGNGIKRPDFLVILKNIGTIAVDVKRKNPQPNYILGEEDEINKYLNFERITRIPVWLVFGYPSQNEQYKSWHWISLSKILEYEKYPPAKEGMGDYRKILPDDTIQIMTGRDTISRIVDLK
jgi:hypothetical protein